jgi:uncharacterized protein involved in tellurium resistance
MQIEVKRRFSMANNHIKNLVFSINNYPDVLDVANRLAKLEDRSAHDTISRLILEAGNIKIEQLEKLVEGKEALSPTVNHNNNGERSQGEIADA